MAGDIKAKNHRLVDKLVIHVETDDLDHEIAYDRFREMLDGYEMLISILEDERTYNPNDTRVHHQESAETKLNHKLYLMPAMEGSFSAEARIYDDSDTEQLSLPFEDQGFNRILTVIDCVSNGDVEEFAKLVPSNLGRQKVIEGVQKVSARHNEEITLTSGLSSSRTTHLKQAEIIPFERLKPTEDEYYDTEVIGRIASVDFESKRLLLRPNGSGRRFPLQYDQEIEDRLMETRYKLMTVKCKVKYNTNGDIADIIDADGIEELTLMPVEIDSFEADGVTHTFKHPITVTTELDETGQIYLGIFEELELCVYVEHQDEMRQEILDDLAWRWSAIAMADRDELAPDARTVKDAFLDLVVV